jgi:putative MATE family efflux protein
LKQKRVHAGLFLADSFESATQGFDMKDLTKGSIVSHIVAMATPIAMGMIMQMLYQLIDLYFVTGLGDAAIAGVAAAGNAVFIVMALTQVLGVGTVALISHAVGRKDQPDANLVFNQSLALSAVCGVFTLIAGYLFTPAYLRSVAADAPTVAAGITYLYWFMPGLALQFALVSMGSALRGTGIVRPTMVVQMLTVIINAILAPILIAGWGTGYAMGVKGAGLASTIAITVGVVMLGMYFRRLEHYVAVKREYLKPRIVQWKRMLNIGLPAGGEMALLFVFTAVIFYCIRNFGAPAQAGFGIGSRVLQAIMLPAMAIAFAAGPIAGQNFGARNAERVKETFAKAALIGSAIMATLTLIAQISPKTLVGIFPTDAEALAVGALFLQMISWNFVAQGFIFTCSSMFQGLGNTVPSLISSGSRLVTFAVPAIWWSRQPDFKIEHVWYLSIASSTLQALTSFWLLRVELKRKLSLIEAPKQAAPALS